MKTTVNTAVAALLAVYASGFATHAVAADKDKPKGEMCYGVVKAGKNDCQTATGSCAGTALEDAQKDAFVYVPKGLCEKIVGGSVKPQG